MPTTYVQAKDTDTWHWCRNCTQFPKSENIKKTTTVRPSFDLCNQCKDKERERNCRT
jgi:hypothetical protein